MPMALCDACRKLVVTVINIHELYIQMQSAAHTASTRENEFRFFLVQENARFSFLIKSSSRF